MEHDAITEILDAAAFDLAKRIDPVSTRLFEAMRKRKVLNNEQLETCKAEKTPAGKVDEILRQLKLSPACSYCAFRVALTDIGRHDLVEKFFRACSAADCKLCKVVSEQAMKRGASPASEGCSTRSTAKRSQSSSTDVVVCSPEKKRKCEAALPDVPKTFKAAFEGKSYDISDKLDANVRLLNLLQRDHKLISSEQRAHIEARESKAAKCLQLLDELEYADDKKVRVFLEDLVTVGQRHVVDIILGRSTNSTDFLRK
jgi:hypothetical protein